MIPKKKILNSYKDRELKFNRLRKEAALKRDETMTIKLSDRDSLLEEYRKLGMKPPSNKIYKR